MQPAIGNDCFYLIALRPAVYCPAKIVSMNPEDPNNVVSLFAFTPSGDIEFHKDAKRGSQPGCWFFRGEPGI